MQIIYKNKLILKITFVSFSFFYNNQISTNCLNLNLHICFYFMFSRIFINSRNSLIGYQNGCIKHSVTWNYKQYFSDSMDYYTMDENEHVRAPFEFEFPLTINSMLFSLVSYILISSAEFPILSAYKIELAFHIYLINLYLLNL